MDWLQDFQERFKGDADISQLAKKKMHGSIQINFCDGHPINYNLTIHKRGTVTLAGNFPGMIETRTEESITISHTKLNNGKNK